jgi:hypothetical protein
MQNIKCVICGKSKNLDSAGEEELHSQQGYSMFFANGIKH